MVNRLELETPNASRTGLALGLFLLALMVVPQVYWLFIGYDNVPSFQIAIWGVALAVILVASYFFPKQSFLFRGLNWVFCTLHVPPRGAWLSLIYAVLIFIISIVALIRA